jgi:hypothetical protein
VWSRSSERSEWPKAALHLGSIQPLKRSSPNLVSLQQLCDDAARNAAATLYSGATNQQLPSTLDDDVPPLVHPDIAALFTVSRDLISQGIDASLPLTPSRSSLSNCRGLGAKAPSSSAAQERSHSASVLDDDSKSAQQEHKSPSADQCSAPNSRIRLSTAQRGQAPTSRNN